MQTSTAWLRAHELLASCCAPWQITSTASGLPEWLDLIVQLCDVVIILTSLGSVKPICAPHVATLLVGASAPGNRVATLGERYQQTWLK